MLYPIGVQTFETIRERNYVYVDKTDFVYELAKQHICFLSRPRRFGKSLLISTLNAYFSGNKQLFSKLKMEKLEHDWKKHPVFRIDFADGDFTKEGSLEQKLGEYIAGWEAIYGKSDIYETLTGRFKYVLEAARKHTGNKVVVLVDEYDKPMLDVIGTRLEEKNRNTLKSFYGTFKSADEHLRFVFLTGVTKFGQISVFSGLNQPNDISMDRQFDSICGITEDELYQYFSCSIKEMAAEYGINEDEMKQMLKKQYDGYHFSDNMLDIYNPFSVINAFSKKKIEDYWYRSGTPTYLVKLLEGHHINMNKLTSQEYGAEYFVDYRADVENPLAMLYQSGYLTIKGYDRKYNEYRLDYPNDEVKRGFVTLLANSYFGTIEESADSWVKNFSRMLNRCDLDGIRDALTSFLSSIPYEANKDERAKDFETHFSYTFYMINRLLSCYITLIEKQNSKGRADIIIEAEDDIFIFEFKLDKSAHEALEQIERMQYALPYLGDSRRIHKIGVSISSRSRTVEEWLTQE